MTVLMIHLILFQSCSNSQERSDQWLSLKTILPGEDSLMPILPGQGFNHVTWKPKGHCVKLGPMKTQSGGDSGHSASFRLVELATLSDLRDSMNISASASFQADIFGSFSSRFNFSRSLKKKIHSRYLLVHIRVSKQLYLAEDFALKKSAQRILSHDNQARFLESCGTKFVYGVRTGGEFFAIFEFSLLNRNEERRLSSAIKSTGFAWKAVSRIDKDLRKISSNLRVNIFLHRVGGRGSVPDVKSVSDFIASYSEIVRQLRDHPIAIELLTKDYSGVKPFDRESRFYHLRNQERILHQLARNRDWALEYLNSLYDINNRHAGSLIGKDLDRLRHYEKKLHQYLAAQNSAANRCFASPLTDCTLPEVTRIDIVLPKKSSGSNQCQIHEFWSPEKQSCCKVDMSGECLVFKNGKCKIFETSNLKKRCHGEGHSIERP